MRRLPLLSLILFAAYFTASSQVEIPVNMYTGTPSISFPIYSLTSKDISVPVSLTYSTNAPTQTTPYGAGWNLQAGGSITREVRGLPDDINNGTQKGWFHIATAMRDSIGSDTKFPSVDSLTSSTTNEVTAWKKLKSYKTFDTEPDIYNYSFNGISGSFLFDNDLSLRTMPYHDIKVTNVTGGFAITTNDGYVYTFTQASLSSKRYVMAATDYSIRDRELYGTTEISFTQQWQLTKIESPNLNSVIFEYIQDNTTGSFNTRQINLGRYEPPNSSYDDIVNFGTATVDSLLESTERYLVSKITGSSGEQLIFEYDYNNKRLQSIELHDLRKGSTGPASYVKSFFTSYLTVPMVRGSNHSSSPEYWMGVVHYLTSITEQSACERIPPVRFEYYGLVPIPEPDEPRYSRDTIPDIIYSGVDVWGNASSAASTEEFIPKTYIYPSESFLRDRYSFAPRTPHTGTEITLEGSNRKPLQQLTGVLRMIITPQGGSTHFMFSPHRYLDPQNNQEMSGGGLRIAEIAYYDGISNTPVTKKFSYVDPATGKTSGRLLRKPMLAMPVYRWKGYSGSRVYNTSYGDDNWRYLTYRSEHDLTPGDRTQGSVVGYKVVTVSRPGSGSARYEYEMPAVYGDNVHGEWRATSVKIARPSGTTTLGIIESTAPWGYPYVPNPDYDYARGLPWKKTEFNEAGKKVRMTHTTYQDIFKSTATEKVWGLRFERFLGTPLATSTYFFGRYFLLTDVIRVPKVETTYVYDLSDATENTYTASSIEYIYGSTAHRFLTQVKNTTSDGTVYSSFMKYPQDYPLVTSGADEAIMIGKLRDPAVFRHGSPIEQYQTIKRGTATARVIGGSIVKLAPMGLNRPMIRSTWQLKANPSIRLDSFTVSSIVTTGGNRLRIDRRYEKTDSILSYGTNGELKSSYNPTSRKASSVLYGYAPYTTPIALAGSATINQVAFSDFEATTADRTFQSTQAYYGSGHTGGKSFYPGVALTRSDVEKAANVTNYIIAFWAKATLPFTLNVYVKPTSGSTPYTTTPISVTASGTAWKYYQAIVPLGSAPNPFKVEILGALLAASPAGGPANGGYLSTLAPVIDDVFFYPETAAMNSMTYHFPFGTASSTTSLGNTSYTEYDLIGRVTLQRDKDRNIISRTQYNYDLGNPLVASFTASTYDILTGVEVEFTASDNPCLEPTYEWDWGDGEGFVSGTQINTHTFDSAGDYRVQLRVTSGIYTRTYNSTFTVKLAPIFASICAKGGREFNTDAGVYLTPAALTYACSQITTALPHPMAVIFRATPTNSTDDAITYKWWMKEMSGFNWTVVGYGNQYVFPKVVTATQSFEIYCELIGSDGRTGTTDKMDVIVYH